MSMLSLLILSLYSIFQEIILWGRTSSATILSSLPENLIIDSNEQALRIDDSKLFDVVTLTLPSQNQPRSTSRDKRSLSNNIDRKQKASVIGLTFPGYSLAMVTIAAQVILLLLTSTKPTVCIVVMIIVFLRHSMTVRSKSGSMSCYVGCRKARTRISSHLWIDLNPRSEYAPSN
jgi:hypothetical protein